MIGCLTSDCLVQNSIQDKLSLRVELEAVKTFSSPVLILSQIMIIMIEFEGYFNLEIYANKEMPTMIELHY